MSQKKGKVPAHIQPKIFHHPQGDSPWVSILKKVNDPREPSCNTRHCVTTVVFIAFTTILCGATNWEEMYYLAIGEDFYNWLSSYVDLSGGIPSKWTLERVISLISTTELYPLFEQFREHAKKIGTIAIDGKTLCGSRDWDKKHPLHLLHAWSVEDGICIGQAAVDEKSNEITAFPELISRLEVQGSVVTADAIHTQKTSVKTVTDKKADYAFPVKENQSNLLEDIKLLFAEADKVKFLGIDAAHTETLEKKGGRVESRKYELLDATGLPGIEEWAGCQCAGRVTRKRMKGEKISEEVIYYITSLDFEIEPFAKAVREHWGVESAPQAHKGESVSLKLCA